MKFIARNVFLIITIISLISCVVLVFTDVERAKPAMGVTMISFALHIFFWILVGTTGVDKKNE
jgi:hypothetical protein